MEYSIQTCLLWRWTLSRHQAIKERHTHFEIQEQNSRDCKRTQRYWWFYPQEWPWDYSQWSCKGKGCACGTTQGKSSEESCVSGSYGQGWICVGTQRAGTSWEARRPASTVLLSQHTNTVRKQTPTTEQAAKYELNDFQRKFATKFGRRSSCFTLMQLKISTSSRLLKTNGFWTFGTNRRAPEGQKGLASLGVPTW